MKYNKEKTRQYIDEIFEYIDNGECKIDEKQFHGHPGLYFFHTKDELNKKIEECLNKEFYDKYDIYYIVSKLIKFMLDKYDSHTKMFFNDATNLPLKFKTENNRMYVIRQSDDLDSVLGSELISINNVSIDNILDEIKDITCYSTRGYLETNQEGFIRNPEMLKSLPSIDNGCETITYGLLHNKVFKQINIDINNKLKPLDRVTPLNYSYEIVDNCLIINYNECKNEDKMNNMIKQISKINDIENYIVDLRNNGGGNSEIIKPLIKYLENKNIVVLINEKVFSSGRMALIDLKNIGAYSIGTDISTSLNAFGNVPCSYNIPDLDLYVKRSCSYWMYDKNYRCKGYTKDDFTSYFKKRRDLLEPILLHPDEYVDLTIEDIINNNDVQLRAALNYFKRERTFK